ncbi:hypothetical protein EC968_003609 [Mortierella alpina]|nr:hypothetical protein EC968_003609 [Mortierella alpina]
MSPKAVYCCCFPLSSGAWVIPLFLAVPSLILVLAMNFATVKGVFRINTPVQLRIAYSVIYSLYALLGVAVGVAFHRLVPNRRFKVLIVLYWILIILIITEGVYFGIMMSKLKSKFVSYCEEVSAFPGAGRGSPATASPAMPTPVGGGNEIGVKGHNGSPRPQTCNKPHAIVGVFYIVGPGGWVILHCAWIMIIALYSKALRREYPADEECGSLEAASRVYAYQPPPKTLGFFGRFSGGQTKQQNGASEKAASDMEMLSGAYRHQHHPFQNALPSSPSPQPQRPSSGVGAVFRSMKSRSASNSPELDRRQSGPSEANGQSATDDTSDDDSDAEDLQHSHHTRAARGSGSEGSMSSRGDIPADGKGWWIRQIEGKRRGEICPCTLASPLNTEEDGSCWCGKQRQAGQTRVSLGSSSQTMRGRDSKSSLQRPTSPGSHSATASSAIEEPPKDLVAADCITEAPAKEVL